MEPYLKPIRWYKFPLWWLAIGSLLLLCFWVADEPGFTDRIHSKWNEGIIQLVLVFLRGYGDLILPALPYLGAAIALFLGGLLHYGLRKPFDSSGLAGLTALIVFFGLGIWLRSMS